jgi:hypothetical protein
MAFTAEEFQASLSAKHEREAHDAVGHVVNINGDEAATCLHCSNPFGINEGVITDDASPCYACLGD